MRTQEILATVNKARHEIDHGVTPRGTLDQLAADLEAQVRREIASSKGVGSAAKAISAMLKSQQTSRPALSYPWVDAEGRQCVCDGFRAFRLKEHLPLPERPENVGDGVNLDRVFPASTDGWKSLRMPSAKELKEFIAIERAKFMGKRRDFNAVWSFGDHEPSVNAQYLLDAAQVFPDAETILWNTLVSPLLIRSEHGDALVLPTRDAHKTQAAPASDAERQAIERENAEKAQASKEAAERYETIRKAHEEHDAAWEESKAAQYSQMRWLSEAGRATDDATRDAAMDEYFMACEKDAKARLRAQAASQVFDPNAYIELVDLTAILSLLYARDYNAA